MIRLTSESLVANIARIAYIAIVTEKLIAVFGAK
jgi:hypothetical protein